MNTIKIHHDQDAQNPITEWDLFGTFVLGSSRYGAKDLDTAGKYGDPFRDFAVWLYENGYVSYESEWLDYPDDYSEAQEEKALKGLENWVEQNIVWLPVYIYSHGGETISTSPFSCRWDSGQIGYVFATKKECLENLQKQRLTSKGLEQCEKWLKGDVETVDQFVRGDIYGFVVEDENGEHVDSCWGFHGQDVDHIKDHVGNLVTKEQIEEAFENIIY